jgi:hypothetical protein
MYGTYFCKNAPRVDARSLKKAAKGVSDASKSRLVLPGGERNMVTITTTYG